MALTWRRALSWRLGRQLLDPVGTSSVEDIVGRLGAIPAWPELTSELAVGVRRACGRFGDSAAALAEGRVISVFAFSGAVHLMTPGAAGNFLAVRASGRMWELPSWRRYYELEPGDWPAFRDFVRDALSDGPLTSSELTAALAATPRYRNIAAILESGNQTIIKPLTWQGVMTLGPARDGETTFVRADHAPGWAGVPEPDVAGPAVIAAYLRTAGPATVDQLHYWIGGHLGARRRLLTGWLAGMEDRLASVTIAGEQALILREDLAALHAAPISDAVHLLPQRDPWVMTTGSDNAHVVPPGRRDLVSRLANPVLHGGVVSGTWRLRRDSLEVEWFAETGRLPRSRVEAAVAELERFLDRPLALSVTTG